MFFKYANFSLEIMYKSSRIMIFHPSFIIIPIKKHEKDAPKSVDVRYITVT